MFFETKAKKIFLVNDSQNPQIITCFLLPQGMECIVTNSTYE